MEDAAVEQEQAVVTGQMRELMSFARKVARTNVSRPDHRRERHRQGDPRPRHSTTTPPAPTSRSFPSTARPSRASCSKASCSATAAARSPAPTATTRASSAPPKDGTLFLDEIGELGLDLQPKLLRFLESGEICPLGEPSPFTVDVRIVAATNRNLEQLVQDGRFREDLFYRLNVIRLTIPPLRERRDEIPALVHHFVAHARHRSSARARPRRRGDDGAPAALPVAGQRPTAAERSAAHGRARRAGRGPHAGRALERDPSRPRRAPRRSQRRPELAVPLTDKLTPTLSRIEREMIRVALRANHGRLDAAARALGISRKGLYLKRQRLGL